MLTVPLFDSKMEMTGSIYRMSLMDTIKADLAQIVVDQLLPKPALPRYDCAETGSEELLVGFLLHSPDR